jgi:DNA-binding XRE family transcriptional regulator
VRIIVDEGLAEMLAPRGPLPPIPDTAQGRRQWLAAVNPAAARVACGLSLAVVAEALEVVPMTVWRWEIGRQSPKGKAGISYCRVIAGLARHLEVRE